jgi:hypothetical protein
MMVFNNNPEVKEAVEKISAEMPEGGADAIFPSLCDYSRNHFLYASADISGMSGALSSGMLSCRLASDLLVGVVLNKTGGDLPVTRVDVLGGSTPVVTPPITNPGIKIANNVRDGKNRMLFTGGHSMVSLNGTNYCLVSGMTGVIDFIGAEKVKRESGEEVFVATVEGEKWTFVPIGGSTGSGLREFRVVLGDESAKDAGDASAATAAEWTPGVKPSTPPKKPSAFGKRQ